MNSWIILGALFPDIAMYMLLVFELLRGHSLTQIFTIDYNTPLWQTPLAITNSAPLILALALLAYLKNWRALWLFSLAALLHIVFDFALHHDDAHRHFYPLSDYRFVSPVSYWDHAHYAALWAPVELLLIIVTSKIGWRNLQSSPWRWPFAIVMTLGLILQIAMIGWLWFGNTS